MCEPANKHVTQIFDMYSDAFAQFSFPNNPSSLSIVERLDSISIKVIESRIRKEAFSCMQKFTVYTKHGSTQIFTELIDSPLPNWHFLRVCVREMHCTQTHLHMHMQKTHTHTHTNTLVGRSCLNHMYERSFACILVCSPFLACQMRILRVAISTHERLVRALKKTLNVCERTLAARKLLALRCVCTRA
jgi:hypothetical protein